MINIGFMQGRLSPVQNGKIQEFPWNSWESEFEIGNNIGFNLMEWTLDQDKLYENPLMIKIKSLTGDCFMQAPFYKEDGNAYHSLLSDLKNIVSACGELNIKYVLLPLVDNGRIESDTQKNVLLDGLSGIIPLLNKYAMKIVFESDFDPISLKNFISKFDPTYFGINYDTGNSASLGYNATEELLAYGERIDNVHIKDRLFRGTTVPLGEGNANFSEVFAMLRKIQYSGNYILQTARDKDQKHEDALTKFRNFIFKIYEREFTS